MIDTAELTRQEKIQLVKMLEERAKRKRRTLARRMYAAMYGWQREFIGATADYAECCLCAANQIGKTWVGTTIDAFHLTGDYPDDWDGHRFDHAPTCWMLGYSMEKTRDLLQSALFGEYKEGRFTGGLVPAELIESWESASGTPNAMRTVRVKHKSGTLAVAQFWSYSQGQHALMGDVVDWFHVDEEPVDPNIRPQVLTRTINGDMGHGGRGIYTFTPENGRTELVLQFMDTPSKDQFFMMKGWDDAPHMTEEKKARLLAQYPEHQRDMRSKGIPMLGHGRIYDISDDVVLCDPFEIPDHWLVINGMDFGWDHPQAFVQLVLDPDNEIYYLTHSWKKSKVSANEAWGAVKNWARKIPVAWPADGLQHEKGRESGTIQKNHYDEAGFTMIREHTTWPEGGNSVENGLYLILDLMRKGKFKIFRGQPDLMNEFRQYHRNDKGKIVKTFDDLLDAMRYAFMMIRKAIRYGESSEGKKRKKIVYPNRGQI